MNQETSKRIDVFNVAIIVFAALFVAGASGFAFWRAFTTAPKFEVLVGGPPSMRVHAREGVDLELLAKAAVFAVELLCADDAQCRASVSSIDVVVMASDAWTDAYGRRVGGAQTHKTIQIGPDFSALFHELVHVSEEYSGSIDEDHATWGARKIWQRDERFRGWLASITR